MNPKAIILFDLDDTLYKEIDFLKSAFEEISIFVYRSFFRKESILYKDVIFNQMMSLYKQQNDVFINIIHIYQLSNISKDKLLEIYRCHYPNIKLSEEHRMLLEDLVTMGYKIGLITDGRSITQNNKIKALALDKYISHDNIIISEEFGSEKPSTNNFKIFEEKYTDAQFYYIGDNLDKDFIVPNKLGWTTICLRDNGQNIHQQCANIEPYKAPQIIVDKLVEIINYLP